MKKPEPSQPKSTKAASRPAHAPSEKSERATKVKKSTREKIYYAIFVLAWTAFSVIASQYVIAFPMAWLLGTEATEPFWTLIYYTLYNVLALILVLFVPPKLVALYRRNHDKKGQLKPTKAAKNDAAKTGTDTANSLFSTNPEELGVAKWPTFVDIGLAPIAYIAYAVIANIIVNFFTLFSWFDANQEQNVGFGYFITTSDRIFAMLAIVFIAPIVEEIIMRGWLYGKLRDKFKIPLAIFLTSILFAVLHGQLNVGITVFVLSVVLCGLREITGTIWSGMLLHILSNGIAFYILYIGI